MDDAELLMTVYQSISWEELYERVPEIEREEVDNLFLRLRQSIESGQLAPVLDAGDNDAEDLEVPDKAVLRCDGAASGNPGPAGIGMALFDRQGNEIHQWGCSIGEETNNVAEYLAMMEGLRRAAHMDISSIRVLSDSQLLVRQINGQYKVRNARLQELHAESMELLERFDEWDVEHVDRSENTVVDEIAKQQVKRAKHAGT